MSPVPLVRSALAGAGAALVVAAVVRWLALALGRTGGAAAATIAALLGAAALGALLAARATHPRSGALALAGAAAWALLLSLLLPSLAGAPALALAAPLFAALGGAAALVRFPDTPALLAAAAGSALALPLLAPTLGLTLTCALGAAALAAAAATCTAPFPNDRLIKVHRTTAAAALGAAVIFVHAVLGLTVVGDVDGRAGIAAGLLVAAAGGVAVGRRWAVGRGAVVVAVAGLPVAVGVVWAASQGFGVFAPGGGPAAYVAATAALALAAGAPTIGALAALLARVERRALALALAAAAAGAALAAIAIDATPYRPAPRLARGERVASAHGRAAVLALGDARRVVVDRHDVVGSTLDAERQRRAAQLPLLLHDAPRRVLLVGLGTGATAAAALEDTQVERLDVVEPVAAVVDAAARVAHRPSPRARVHVADPRRFVADADATWDVVIADLTAVDAAALTTVEHHEAVAARLAPGGVYAQWLALHELGADDLARLADATRAAFPHVVLWRGDTSRRWGTVALLASRAPLVVDAARWRARAPAVDPLALAMLYMGDWPRRAAPRSTDDRPLVELGAARARRAGATLVRVDLVRFYRDVVVPLPRTVAYRPAAGEAWDPDAGVQLQLGAAGADGE